MSELSDYIKSVDAEEVEAERRTLDELELLFQAKAGVKYWETEVKTYDPDASNRGRMGLVRAWLYDHPDEPLVDQEKGIKARLVSAGTREVYDPVLAIRERSPQVYQRLLELGCLVVDGAAVKAAIAKGFIVPGDVAGYAHPSENTRRLDVGKVEP